MAPLLDFVALQKAPLKSAEALPGLELPELREVLAAAMPGVRHSLATSWIDEQDEHTLVDAATGSAARVVIPWGQDHAHSRTWIGEIGTRPLLEQLRECLLEWELNGRVIPECWKLEQKAPTGHTYMRCFPPPPDRRNGTRFGRWKKEAEAVMDEQEIDLQSEPNGSRVWVYRAFVADW